MLEINSALRRRLFTASAITADGISIKALAPDARFKLRLRESDLTRHSKVAGFILDQPINRFARENGRLAARLGPDEWVLIAPDGEADTIAGELATALDGTPYSLVDIGHRHVAFELTGRATSDLLNTGCALDLHPRAFPVGMATRTLLAKAEILLFRIDDRPSWRLECWRSFADYVHGFLTEAAREFTR